MERRAREAARVLYGADGPAGVDAVGLFVIARFSPLGTAAVTHPA
ncbi:hypothetical protein [Nocardia sp. NPDC005366]